MFRASSSSLRLCARALASPRALPRSRVGYVGAGAAVAATVAFGAGQFAACESRIEVMDGRKISELHDLIVSHVPTALAFFQVMDHYFEKANRSRLEDQSLANSDCKKILQELGLESLTSQASKAAALMIQLFDTDGNGVLDFFEMSCAIPLILDISEKEKYEYLFMACDVNGDGRVQRSEMRDALTFLFHMRFKMFGEFARKTVNNNEEFLNIPPLQVARYKANVATMDIFKHAGKNKKDEMTLNDFMFWVKRGGPHLEFLKGMLNEQVDKVAKRR